LTYLSPPRVGDLVTLVGVPSGTFCLVMEIVGAPQHLYEGDAIDMYVLDPRINRRRRFYYFLESNNNTVIRRPLARDQETRP
jgi:hypothetical protein